MLGATLTLAPAGQVSFAGLNPIDVSGLGLATLAGTYRLIDSTIGPSATCSAETGKHLFILFG
jgi:hypothetical protein